jgi:MtN3 and saliva related transmembrane protein
VPGKVTAELHGKLNSTMSTLTSFLGFSAAALTTIANLPQVLKCWRTGNTDDLSLRMQLALSSGTALWTLYGVSQKDTAIVIGNSISFALALILLFLKRKSERSRAKNSPSKVFRESERSLYLEQTPTHLSSSAIDVSG